MNTPDRPRVRGFKISLVLTVVAAMGLQLWTGSNNPAIIAVPIGLVFAAYMILTVVRARRRRRASGAPRPRVVYPLTFRLAGLVILLGVVAMFVLSSTQKGQAFGAVHTGLKNAIEGLTVLAALGVVQWQRSIIQGQLGANWNAQSDLPSSHANGGRR